MQATKKILVTGASGFVGSKLCQQLERQGIAHTPVARSPISGMINVGELDARTDWAEALQGVSDIIHLAARVHVMNETEADPLAAFTRVNVDATLNLARQAVASGVKRLLYVSSVKVNGEATFDRPYTSTDTPAPEDAYGRSKHIAEQALWALAKESGLEIVVVRPPLVYGPGVKANFRSLMKAVYRRIPLPIGSVNNLRSMVGVDNLVDLLLTAATHPRAAGHTFLASDDHDIGTADLARELGRAMQRPAILVPVPVPILRALGTLTGRSGFIDRLTGSLQVDVSPAKEILGWSPKIGLREGLLATTAHFISSKHEHA